jgi:hypothetical protein
MRMCECGCGEPAPESFNVQTGAPARFIAGHGPRTDGVKRKIKAGWYRNHGRCRAMNAQGERCRLPASHSARELDDYGMGLLCPTHRWDRAPVRDWGDTE